MNVHGTTFTVDASKSSDAVAMIQPVATTRILAVKVGICNYPVGPLTNQIDLFTQLFPSMTFLVGSRVYVVQYEDEH